MDETWTVFFSQGLSLSDSSLEIKNVFVDYLISGNRDHFTNNITWSKNGK